MVSSLLLALGPAALGGLAGLTMRRARARESVAEEAFPPRGMLMRVKGDFGKTTVHAEIRGDGPDLILIHGASGSAREFTFGLMDRLKGRYRVIAFDRPGLGWSDDMGKTTRSPLGQVKVLQAAAARLRVHRPVILGQSYGGAVAMAWALAAPDEVAALVIVSGATHPWSGGLGGWYRLMKALPLRPLLPALVSAWATEDLTQRALSAIFAPDEMPEGYAEHIAASLSLRRATLAANAGQVNALRSNLRDMAPRYPRLPMPLEIVHGTADAIVPIGVHAEHLVRQVQGANLTRIEGAGHMPHHTHPDIVIAAIHRAFARARGR
ncbi:hypothetical protein U879_14990 [Defluviimonas sp. 20V17]|nr:hypothetical protein U879_14990 [Defluviimonas sp. 20V17]